MDNSLTEPKFSEAIPIATALVIGTPIVSIMMGGLMYDLVVWGVAFFGIAEDSWIVSAIQLPTTFALIVGAVALFVNARDESRGVDVGYALRRARNEGYDECYVSFVGTGEGIDASQEEVLIDSSKDGEKIEIPEDVTGGGHTTA